jgi:hypothetical protein
MKIKLICDSNKNDSVEFSAENGNLYICMTNEGQGYSDVFIDRRWAVELVKFLAENIGVEE